MPPDFKSPRPIRLGRSQWKALRDEVCKADDGHGATCVGCGRYFDSRKLSAHHVYPRDLGGDDLRVNLAPLCGHGTAGCHGLWTNRERGWLRVAASVRERWAGEPFRMYLAVKLGGVDQAEAWLDRYYPATTDERERSTSAA